MNYLKMRQLAIRMSNIVKGFIRIITGAPPITLEDCMDDKSVINYQIFGNTVQDGEPTPENPAEVVSVGEYDEETGKYKIPVMTNGINLFNKNDENVQIGRIYVDGSVNRVNATDKMSSGFIPVKPNTTYSQSYKTGASYRVGFYDASYNFDGQCITEGGYSYTTQSNTKYIRVTFPKDQLDNFMVVEGKYAANTIPEYEPYVAPITTNIYLNEPLRAIGNYKDYMDFEECKLIRKVAEEYITTVQYVSSESGTRKKFLSNISNLAYTEGLSGGQKGFALSNKFKQSNVAYTNLGNNGDGGYIQTYITNAGVSRIAYTFPGISITTIDQAQAAIKEGFDVTYILAVPTEETIDLSNLPTFKGQTTIFKINTTVQPTEISVTYYSNKKGE